MNQRLQRGLMIIAFAAACPFFVSALKPYKPEVTAKFSLTDELQGKVSLNLTAPTAESVMTGGWWPQESEGDPLPDGTVMTLTVTRSCSALKESNIPVFSQENVTPGQSFELADNNAEYPLQIGYSYTYYCKAAITVDDTTEESTEASSGVKYGVTLDMSSAASFTENADGSVTISYTLPSTYGNGEALPVSLTSFEVYRLVGYDTKPAADATPIFSKDDPQAGDMLEFSDTEPIANQLNKWYFKALCSLGDGNASVEHWVGYDVPRGVSALTGVAEDNGVRLSWEAPTEGRDSYNGSKFDPEQTKYRIYRVFGYNDTELIAEDLTDTEYFDDAADLEAPIKINYAVEAYNEVGASSLAYPDNTYAATLLYIIGPKYSLPFEEKISKDQTADRLWIVDKPSGGMDWEFRNPFTIGYSYNPTAEITGADGNGVMGVNYTGSYNRADIKSSVTSYAIDFSKAGKPMLRFSYYGGIPVTDVQFDVIAIADGESEVLKNIKISEGADINSFIWTDENWREVEIDLSEYAGTEDFRLSFSSWYSKTAHAVMISDISIVDEAPLAATFIVDDIEYEVIGEEAGEIVTYSAARSVKAIKYHGSEVAVSVPASVENAGETFDVAEVASGAFAGHSALESADIKTPVIAGGAFENCPELTKVTMDASTSSIGTRAFADCQKLSRVEFASLSVPDVADDAFTGISPKCTGKCPDEAYNSYKAHSALKGITFDVPTGVESVWAVADKADVYTVEGVLVLRDADSEALGSLAPGIYVISAAGKTFKIIVR